MKRICSFVAVIACCLQLSAVKYCAEASWGYGSSATGGGNAKPTLVSTYDALKNALKNDNKVIIITQDITVNTPLYIDGKTNITLMALPGIKLVNPTRTKTGSGILQIKNNSSNIILRNLTFEGPGAYDCNGRDNLTITSSQNIWVDHCDFQDGMDGNFDINTLSDNITVTWCRFRYFIAPIPAGEGGDSDDHRFSNLVGSSSTDKPTDGTYNITYGFCWWDEGCKQRMTRCRNAELHFLNCYWNSSVADYYVGPENAKCYFEGCTFAGKANSASGIWSPYSGSTNSCKFIRCSGNLPSNSGSVSAPSYTYDQLTAADAKKYVTNSTCGAGATLTVTTTAEVSSSCADEGGEGGGSGDITSGEYCINLGLGEAPSTDNDGIPEGLDKLNISTSFNHTSSGWNSLGYLNLGSNTDYISFDFSAYNVTIESVKFDVTIPNWAESKKSIEYHWNQDANTTYSISSADKETVSLTAPSNAKSFTIKRSASKGTQIRQVCFQIKVNTATAIETPPTKNAAHKVLREGRILILRDGKTYNVLGLNQ